MGAGKKKKGSKKGGKKGKKGKKGSGKKSVKLTAEQEKAIADAEAKAVQDRQDCVAGVCGERGVRDASVCSCLVPDSLHVLVRTRPGAVGWGHQNLV